jgi:hypothetical protein
MLKTLFILIFVLSALNAQTLLFKSGFEKEVYLDSNFADEDGFSAEQWIYGTDEETGFTWPIQVLGGTGRLHLIGYDERKAIQNDIKTVIGHTGTETKVLEMKQPYIAADGIGQCPYSINDITEGTSDLYIKYWIKISSDWLETIGTRGSWRTFFEWKSKDYRFGTGFRLISYIYSDQGSNVPYWHWQGDANPGEPVWEIDNKDIPVPIGEWFLTEFYWHWSEGNDGRALWKVNGEVVGDHYGPTTRNSKPIDFIMLTQIYGITDDGDTSISKLQWVDDIEIWDAIPTATSVNKFSENDQKLLQIKAYPNPFNPTTKIKYSISTPPQSSHSQGEGERDGLFVSLKVYDVIGKEVTTLVNRKQKPGKHEILFDASNLPSGIYFCNLNAGKFSKTIKLFLVQ